MKTTTRAVYIAYWVVTDVGGTDGGYRWWLPKWLPSWGIDVTVLAVGAQGVHAQEALYRHACVRRSGWTGSGLIGGQLER